MSGMKLDKLTTILIVDRIEPCLPAWKRLGYEVTVRVPKEGSPGFVILAGHAGELMMQTRESLADDLPDVAKRKPTHLLYGDVGSVTSARKALSAKVIVEERKTFYGALETWLELEG